MWEPNPYYVKGVPICSRDCANFSPDSHGGGPVSHHLSRGDAGSVSLSACRAVQAGHGTSQGQKRPVRSTHASP